MANTNMNKKENRSGSTDQGGQNKQTGKRDQKDLNHNKGTGVSSRGNNARNTSNRKDDGNERSGPRGTRG